jgi:hypothetical protein
MLEKIGTEYSQRVNPQEAWCAVQGLNLQNHHLRRYLPVVPMMFHCHSLPVEQQRNSFVYKCFAANSGKFGRKNLCKSCANIQLVQKLCNFNVAPKFVQTLAV